MDIKSLELKNKLIDDSSGEEYFDLTAPSFRYDSENGVRAIHYVLADQAGRIDIIANIYFGSSEYIDAICVVNNIFNPLSIQEGDILVIPNLRNEDQLYKRPEIIQSANEVQAPFIDTERSSQKDQSRINRLKEKSKQSKNPTRNPLPPNMLQPGEIGKTTRDRRIQLGTNLNSNGRE